MAFSGIPAVIQFIGFIFLPESPRWLATHGKEKEAKEVLVKIYGEDSWDMVEFEMREIKEANEELIRDKETHGKACSTRQK